SSIVFLSVPATASWVARRSAASSTASPLSAGRTGSAGSPSARGASAGLCPPRQGSQPVGCLLERHDDALSLALERRELALEVAGERLEGLCLLGGRRVHLAPAPLHVVVGGGFRVGLDLPGHPLRCRDDLLDPPGGVRDRRAQDRAGLHGLVPAALS